MIGVWGRNYYKAQGRGFCFQHILAVMNTVRKADGNSLVSPGITSLIQLRRFCLSFVFLRGKRLLFDGADPFALLSGNQES